MCGKCGKMAARGGCVAKLIGVVFMALAAATRFCNFSIHTLGPRSFAAAAALLLLLSIAVNSCPCCGGSCKDGACGSDEHEHEHEHPSEGKKS